jgi:uncharacterized membrane protein YccC
LPQDLGGNGKRASDSGILTDDEAAQMYLVSAEGSSNRSWDLVASFSHLRLDHEFIPHRQRHQSGRSPLTQFWARRHALLRSNKIENHPARNSSTI